MGVQNIATREMIQNVVDGVTPVAKATNATNAVNDGNGQNIANTYATKEEISGGGGSKHTHIAYIYASTQNTTASRTESVFIVLQYKSSQSVPFSSLSDLLASDAVGYWPCTGDFSKAYQYEGGSGYGLEYAIALYCNISSDKMTISGLKIDAAPGGLGDIFSSTSAQIDAEAISSFVDRVVD